MNCDVCARKGINIEATHDAPLPSGPWAFVCGACLYRLPEFCKRMATKLRRS